MYKTKYKSFYDDKGYHTSRLLVLPIMHERDMFLLISNVVFETILHIWTYVEDDSIMNRYSTNIKIELYHYLNRCA